MLFPTSGIPSRGSGDWYITALQGRFDETRAIVVSRIVIPDSGVITSPTPDTPFWASLVLDDHRYGERRVLRGTSQARARRFWTEAQGTGLPLEPSLRLKLGELMRELRDPEDRAFVYRMLQPKPPPRRDGAANGTPNP